MKKTIYRLLTVAFLMVVFLLFNAFAKVDHKLDKYGGWKGVKGEKTGYFHLEEIDGRNWFINPLGNVFFPVALSHLYSGESKVPCENVYGGNEDLFYEDALKIYREMGFNCALGSATSPERNLNGFVNAEKAEQLFRENNFPYTVGVILMKHPWEFVEGETLPDIFEPAYKELIESRAKAVCPKYKDDPLVMGYYYGFGAFNHAAIWVNHHLSLPPKSAGRDAVVDFLASRYKNSVSKFNKIYGLSLSEISDLKEKEVLEYDEIFEMRNYEGTKKELNSSQLTDFEAIIAHMCVSLYKIAHDAIRKYDTNHLIFGSFVKEWALSPESWKAAAPYIDMIAPQHVNRDISHFAAAEAAGLPVLMSDDYFGNYYASGHPGHAGLTSHEARGEVYKANLMRQYKDPMVVGVTYCAGMWDQSGLYTNGWKVENGFIDIHGNRREELMQEVTKINKEVYMHAKNPASAGELKMLDQVLYYTWDKYQRGDTGLWK